MNVVPSDAWLAGKATVDDERQRVGLRPLGADQGGDQRRIPSVFDSPFPPTDLAPRRWLCLGCCGHVRAVNGDAPACDCERPRFAAFEDGLTGDGEDRVIVLVAAHGGALIPQLFPRLSDVPEYLWGKSGLAVWWPPASKTRELQLGVMSRAGDNEPTFTLRARDPLAADIVDAWADQAEQAGVPAKKVAEARAVAALMRAYPDPGGD